MKLGFVILCRRASN